MSTQITTIEYLTPERLTITAEAIGQARMKLLTMAGGMRLIPEDSFLQTHVNLISDGRGSYKIADIGWTDDNADHLEHLATALSFTRGSADLLLVWEGARAMQPFTGLRVVDGVVTMHQVVMSLGAEVSTCEAGTMTKSRIKKSRKRAMLRGVDAIVRGAEQIVRQSPAAKGMAGLIKSLRTN